MRKNRRSAESAGFSLIELMVVICIMAMLAGGVSIYLLGAKGDAEKARVRSDFAQLDDAMKIYRLKMNKYPDSIEELTKPLPGHAEGLLKKAPRDPWGEPYIYKRVEDGFEIRTLGADKADGGTGSDADLSNLDEEEGEETK